MPGVRFPPRISDVAAPDIDDWIKSHGLAGDVLNTMQHLEIPTDTPLPPELFPFRMGAWCLEDDAPGV